MHLDVVRPAERAALLSLAVATGLFTPDHAEELLGGVLTAWDAGALPPGHRVVACRDAGTDTVLGWSYVAPDPYADRIWNLWWIGADPTMHGTGAGAALLADAEHHAASHEGRLLIIETSDGAPMARARAFYAKHGYVERGRIPDFYAEGEAKVIFARRVA